MREGACGGPGSAVLRFRFSPLLLGSWQIDDVYVDPARMR
jgi:hypothetical protein